MKFALIIIFSLFSIILFAENNPTDKTQQAKEWLKNQPLAFIENKGQFTNSDGKPADNVLFKASYGDCDIYITTEGISYVFVKYDKVKGQSLDTNDILKKYGQKGMENKTVSYYRLDMNLQGSNISKTQIIKELPGKQGVTNYFYPHCPDGIYGVQEYGKITIKNIYKGIDWVIYTNADNKQSPLKYDFVVQPQANYKDIKIKFVNAQSTSLADNGSKLKIQTIAGNIEEGNLFSYLENSSAKQAIKTNYVANADSTLEFEIGDYDKTKTLVIDPLVWATYYGGSVDDQFYSICADSQDNIYITGIVSSPDFPTQPLNGAFWQDANKIFFDILILKFDSQEIRQWATYYGGSLSDEANSIYADKKDNIYITGSTVSTDLPIQKLTGAYLQSNSAGLSDLFVLKFSASSVLLWATYYGGSADDFSKSICGDSQDNIYITGNTFSTNFPVKQLTGAFNQPKYSDVSDAFVLKFNTNNECLWSTYYGGNYRDLVSSLAVDNLDNLFIIGNTDSPDFPTQLWNGAYNQSILAGARNSFILKFNNLGIRQWATFYGGSYADEASSIIIDGESNIYITGWTGSGDFPLLNLLGAYNQSAFASGGGMSAFILKFNRLGVRLWATFYGGDIWTKATSICSDNENNIYITGTTFSTNLPTQKSAGEYYKETNSGIYDVFILKFNYLGERQWATYYGTTYWDEGFDIVADKKGSVYIIGCTNENGAYTIDYGNGSYYDGSCNGSNDGFILKIKNCRTQKPSSVQSDRNNICINETGNIILTAIGGIGDTLKWYSDKEGLNYLGKGPLFTVPVPAKTTTYYARWESLCDTSMCDSVVINIYSEITKNISPVICQGDTCKVGTSIYTVPGIYTDALFTASGCDSIVTTNLLVNPVQLTVQSPPICEGETFTVGTNSYTLTGTYRDVLKTYLGCDSTVVTNLLVNPIKRTPLTRFICQGESFIVGTKVHTTTGIYSDTLTSFLFCDSIVTTNLTVHPAYQPTPSPSICPGETVTVGTHTYNVSGTYIDKLLTIYDCDSIITTNLTVYTVEQNIQFPDKCTGESITVGLNTYTETGIYTEVLTSSHNCDSTVITHLTINPTVLNPITESICKGETFTVGTNVYSSPGNYIDVLRTSLGCDSTVTTILTVNPLPDVSLGDDLLLCTGDSLILTPGNGFISYLWSDGSVLNNLKVTTTGNYSVTAYNQWCPASDEIAINECGTELWFPNAFSPNNDTKNETFKPVILGTIKTFHIIIYTRWGQQIYESNVAIPGWDGTFQGSDCATGQYVYVATYSMGTEPATQQQRVQRGAFALLR